MAQPPVGWLPAGAVELFGEGASAEESYGLLTVDVPAAEWTTALETARDTLGCTYFDWLSAVDEPGTGFRISAHVVAIGTPAGSARPTPAPTAGPAAAGTTATGTTATGTAADTPVTGGAPAAGGSAPRRLLVRTTVPHDAPALPTASGVYAGADWHERETHEMFGVDFTGHPHLVPLLLPEGFEGHPLRKDFVLAARVVKAWPGAKEPGESEHGGPKRRQMLPPGVPDPNEWGPLKGQLPPAPARPARGARAAAGDRPPRRARTAGAGSASQQPEAEASSAAAATTPTDRPARRTRSATEGTASGQQPEATDTAQPTAPEAITPEATAPKPPAPNAAAPEAPAPESPAPESPAPESLAPEAPAPEAPAADAPAVDAPTAEAGPATSRRTGGESAGKRSADAPWHNPRPAHDAPATTDGGANNEPEGGETP
ncbi:NADH-quinone oxidoreductase subunit C [Streptomyces sp. NPDC004647]|uniref:NADH-quinone oxidoreductase subunit C n=1 Tax=Streptomyces sp. NPDC004647 TaxID=3154671 RepID=UPI0033B1B29C